MTRQRSRRERTLLGQSSDRSGEPERTGPTPSLGTFAPATESSSNTSPPVSVTTTTADSDSLGVPSDSLKAPLLAQRPIREVLEAIAITIAAALLFRTFLAEPFLIPTGSMAPSLMGRHVDLICPECGRPFQAGASAENGEGSSEPWGLTVSAYCPDCRYPVRLDRGLNPAHDSFDGDRVVVSKFFYDLFTPERWDVIVFKFPGNPKINYIKRLIGKPGETIRIRDGDIATSTGRDAPFTIARKPPEKTPCGAAIGRRHGVPAAPVVE